MATLKQNQHGFNAKNGASKGAKSISNTSGNTERDGINAHKVANYTIEDKKNVINFNKSGRSKPHPHELESLRRQYGHRV